MRLVNISCINGYETLARDIIVNEGVILLRKGTKLKSALVEKLKEFNVKQIYIEDAISEGITPDEVISFQEKQRLVSDLTEEFGKLKDKLLVDTHVIHKIATSLTEKFYSDSIIIDLMNIQANDDYTYMHCLNVAILTTTLCNKLKIDADTCKKIVVGALLHDVGKILVPKDILNKPTKLTEQEFNIMKQHSVLGYDILKDNQELDPISKIVVLCHHERSDGSGYPLGKTDDLHIGAKIVAACDIFDALVSDRPYRKGFELNEACIILKKEKIDNQVREALEKMIAFYPVGSTVLLSNGIVGIVEKNFAGDLNKPNVRGVYHVREKKLCEQRICLRDEKDIYIVSKLDGIPTIDNIQL